MNGELNVHQGYSAKVNIKQTEKIAFIVLL